MERPIRFVAIDIKFRRDAEGDLATHYASCSRRHLERLYRRGAIKRRSTMTSKMIEYLKIQQKELWKCLFERQFDQRYFNNSSLTGIEHFELVLDAKWHIAGQMKIKSGF